MPAPHRELRLVVGEGDRGPIVAATTIVGALAILAVAVVASANVKVAAPAILLVVVAAASYRTLLRWQSLVTSLMVIVLFVPIRRYTLPGSLPFQLEPYRVITMFIAAGWVASLLVDPRVRLRRTCFDAPLAAVAASMLISDAMNGPRIHQLGVQSEVLKKLTFFASFFAIAYVIPSVIKKRADIDRVVNVLAAGGAALAVFALYESWTHHNVFNDLARYIPLLKLDQLPYSLVSVQNDRGGQVRAYGPAQSPIAFGALFVMLLPLGIYAYQRARRRLWGVVALLILLGAIATVSRTPILMLVVTTIVYWRFRGTQVKRLWPAVLPLLIAVHFALPGTIGSIKSAFFPKGGIIAEQQAGAGTYGSGRLADLVPGLHDAETHLTLGQGFGTRLTDRSSEKVNAPILDDQWLGTLLETGVFGVAAWVWFFSSFYRRMLRAAQADDTSRAWLFAGLGAAMLAFALSLATYDTFSFIQETIVAFVYIGLAGAALAERDPVRVAS